MGLFGSFFEKKNCSICGKEIGRFFGNNKLADGNMCKECASKLSPFFTKDFYKETTVEDINWQLEYREENKELLDDFNVTQTIGGSGMQLLIDEYNGQFVALPNGASIEEYNPDLFSFDSILGCHMETYEDEEREEILCLTEDGDEESYFPPRYNISYVSDVYVLIDVEHELFNQISFKVNDYTIRSSYQNCSELRSYERIGQQMIDYLDQAREFVYQEEAPVQAVICPHCGATTLPDLNGCCEYCGSALLG